MSEPQLRTPKHVVVVLMASLNRHMIGAYGGTEFDTPKGANAPLSLWSNRWSKMPIHRAPDLQLPPPGRRARLDFMSGSNVSVIRQPFEALPPSRAGRGRGHPRRRSPAAAPGPTPARRDPGFP